MLCEQRREDTLKTATGIKIGGKVQCTFHSKIVTSDPVSARILVQTSSKKPIGEMGGGEAV